MRMNSELITRGNILQIKERKIQIIGNISQKRNNICAFTPPIVGQDGLCFHSTEVQFATYHSTQFH